ncbi:MAG: GNAT family N-acetyltransferase [Chloroflexota bacterium]|nr:GNAT family N-acetyltransferase [Chloroflexota bacterium]
MGEPRWVAVGRLTRIREFTRRDVDRWLEWGPHPDPLYSSYNPTPMDGSLRDAWYDDLVHRQGQWPFAIEDRERQLIGRLFLRHIRRREGTSVLGIDLAASALGRGYGTDALRAFLDYYFGPMGFQKMYLSVAAHNPRAYRLYENCGFRRFNAHWQTFKTDADVLRDPRYRDVSELFRPVREGVEGLMYDMVLTRAAWLAARRSGREAIAQGRSFRAERGRVG